MRYKQSETLYKVDSCFIARQTRLTRGNFIARLPKGEQIDVHLMFTVWQ